VVAESEPRTLNREPGTSRGYLTRRELLRTSMIAAGLFARPALANQNQGMTIAVVDHLLLGVADLDRGIEWVEQRTGVRAAIGGSHPGAGTRNALLSLGGSQYLEIIAPDPAQSTYTFRMDLKSLTEPRLVSWAAKATAIEAVAKKGRAAGLEMLGPRDGSRVRPDGKTLKWKTLSVTSSFVVDGIDPVPFFIEWAAGTVHPSQDAPSGCSLRSFEIEHPRAAAVAETLMKAGLEIVVRQAAAARLVAAIETRKGPVTLR
jgi:Glyoxalase-like domain